MALCYSNILGNTILCQQNGEKNNRVHSSFLRSLEEINKNVFSTYVCQVC